MKEEIEQLKKQIADLESKWDSLTASHKIPLNIDQAFRARFLAGSSGILTVAKGGTGLSTISSGGILKGAGTSPITTIAPLSGGNTFWVANTSGGVTTKGINITDGIVTSFFS